MTFQPVTVFCSLNIFSDDKLHVRRKYIHNQKFDSVLRDIAKIWIKIKYFKDIESIDFLIIIMSKSW